MHHTIIGPRTRAGAITRLAVAAIAVGAVFSGCTSGRDDSDASTSTSTPVDSVAVTSADSADPIGSNASAEPTVSATPDTNPPDNTDPVTSVEASTTELPTTTSSTTTTTEPPTTTTTIVTQGAIVIVANATKVPGAAAKLTDLMSRYGFQMGAPTDAAGNEEFRDTTQVYCLPGSEAVAGSIAILLGVPVNYMPTPAPITDATVGLGDASVLVMLGKDLAGKDPPGLFTS
jgi:hypothetical protein